MTVRSAWCRPSWRSAAVALAAWLGVASGVAAQSLDRVRLTDKKQIIGELVAVGPNDVEIKDQLDDQVKRVPIDGILEIQFAGEPESLRSARGLLLRQDPAGAIEELNKIEKVELDGASDNVLTEARFVGAAAAARVAMMTGAKLAEAEKGLRDFLAKHARSHNVHRASELLGDLLVRAGKFEEAAAAYAGMEKGPPAYRVRAAAAKANVFYEQKRYPEAQREFESAAKTETDPDDVASAVQKRIAELGRSRCLARQGKAADAVAAAQGVIRQADPDDRETLGRAYTVLGDALRAVGGKDQDAVIAFLTVDLVYNESPESHAEALFNLAQLWDNSNNPERSRAARQVLETAYPESRWTKSLAAGGKAP